jgi:GT2 family glycosyltransferase
MMQDKKMKDLSVIIVCYKGWEKLRKCLISLENLKSASFTSEVIVVDNKSDDGTLEEIKKRFSGYIFLSNDVNGGFGNGCNKGAMAASGEYLLFLNPDTESSEKSIADLLYTAKQNPAFTILSCRQVSYTGKESKAIGDFPEYYNLTGLMRSVIRKNKAPEIEGDIIFPDWVSGSVMLIRKDSFGKLNGFDDDFWMYYEDVDICRRVVNSGGKIAFCRNITVTHNHGGSSRINLKTASLTKTEVHISRHVYIDKHKHGLENALIQIFLVINNVVTNIITGLAGLIFFFIPKAFLRFHILGNLLKYYLDALFNRSWLSCRSVNYCIKK